MAGQHMNPCFSASPGPRYLGFVTGGSTPAALAGDWLVSAYDQNVGSDGDSIARRLSARHWGCCARSSAFRSRLKEPLSAGRRRLISWRWRRRASGQARRLGMDVSEQGLWKVPPLPVLGGSPHASIVKALSMLGMGRQAMEVLPCLPGKMAVDPEALTRRLAALNGAPAIVVASAGEVNTGDFDDLEALAGLCQKYGAWLHVDGGLWPVCRLRSRPWPISCAAWTPPIRSSPMT